MAWTDTARRQHMRNGPGYPSDLRDGEWALIEPMLPSARSGGRPRTTRLQAVMDAILYIASSGCAWRMLPKCFPPISTVRGYFYGWRDSGLLTTINHLLAMTARQQAGREASPTAGVIDSQSVRTTESGGISGYDAGKKVKDALKGHGRWTLEIIKRSDTAKGFEILPRRWVVERTFAWLGRCRRLAKDWERSIESSTAWATIASIRMLTRRIATFSTH